MNKCKLCIAIDDSLRNGYNSLIENRLLFSTKSFIATPSIGALKPGHIILSSKEHYISLASMEEKQIDELKKIVLLINKNSNYKDYIIVEHGPVNDKQKGGACIVHTHLHIIPRANKLSNYFDKILNFEELKEFNEVTRIKYPYLLVAYRNKIRIFNAKDFPSQYIRRIYFSIENITFDWDWRVQPQNNYIKQTIMMWKNDKK